MMMMMTMRTIERDKETGLSIYRSISPSNGGLSTTTQRTSRTSVSNPDCTSAPIDLRSALITILHSLPLPLNPLHRILHRRNNHPT